MDKAADSAALHVPGGDPSRYETTLFASLLAARADRGAKTPVVEDAERQPLTLGRLALGAGLLGGKIAKVTERGERVGVLLPNSNGAAVTFYALQAIGRVPAMLNFSIGLRNMLASCRAAEVRTVLTSRRFVSLAKLEDQIEELERRVRVVWLEDVRASIGTLDKLSAVLGAGSALRRHQRLGIDPNEPAVVLFTSGTEGVPKGVVLSHRAILANCEQVLRVLSFTPGDVMFNALPVFHSFGLTVGMILPLYAGFRTMLYPSPLHYKQIPPLIRDTKATILLSTDTFLQGWAKAAEGDEFATLRLIVLGAERVKQPTREMCRARFGLELNEGYGVTETAPVLAVNTPEHSREGTVGKLFPGIEWRLDPVSGLPEGGRLVVRGPNNMSGYLFADNPGVLVPPQDGWHDTGDIVTIDSDGFVAIKGRAKRFAKIGGEMVSLAAVEAYAASLWPDSTHAVLAVDDARRGEQLVLITDCVEARREALLAWARANGVGDLLVPRQFVRIDEMPVLGTGKLDYAALDSLAREAASRAQPAPSDTVAE